MSSLLVVVDAAAPGLSELLLHARRVVCSKAASFEPGMLAMTAFGSTTTRNRLSEAGMAGYQGVHTLFELAPCCTAALDGLDALQALEGVKSDIFDALVAAVYELHCKDNDGQRRREILVLCDAQRHADDDAFEEDTAQLLKGIDDLGITISVVSTTPLPASGVLHTLFNSLGGGRFEFARLEGAGLHAQAGCIGPEQVERKGEDSKREAELEAEREVCISPSADNNSSASSSFTVCCEYHVLEGGAKRPRNQISLSDRVDADRRIRWGGTRLETLDDWLSSVPPSKVSPDVAAWIQVENVTHKSPGFRDYNAGPYVRELDKIKALIASSGRVPAAAKKACVQAILSLAQEQRYTTGKWMIFFPSDEADAGWGIIARATAEGQLGCSAKIAPAQDSMPGGKGVLCCIYVYDFADRAEVRRVLLALHELGMNIRSGFKPDIFTALNINGGNEWRLEPTIFRVEEASAWPADIARETYQRVRASPWESSR